MKNITKETIELSVPELEKIFLSFEPKLLEIFDKTKNSVLIDHNGYITLCNEMIPFGFSVVNQYHLINKKKGYIDFKIKFLTESNVIERTLFRIAYSLEENSSWISSVSTYNIIRTEIQLRKVVSNLVKEISLKIDNFISNRIQHI
jgi:hypothetical protein